MDKETKAMDLSIYRINNASETLDTAKLCVATDIFDREIGKRLGRLKRKREASDYDDFYVASREEAKEQYEAAELIVQSVQAFLIEKDVLK